MSNQKSLTFGEALFSLILAGIGVAVIWGFLSTFQSIPTEATYLLICSITFIATALGYVFKKRWAYHTYILIMILMGVFFLSVFRNGFSGVSFEVSLGVSYLIRLLPLVIATLFLGHVKSRVTPAQQ